MLAAFQVCFFFFSQQGLSPTPELALSARLASQKAPRVLLCPSPQCREYIGMRLCIRSSLQKCCRSELASAMQGPFTS